MSPWEHVGMDPEEAAERERERMAPHPPAIYRCEFVFTRRSTSRRAVQKKVFKLMETADAMGFKLVEGSYGREEEFSDQD
jgi:hypothetical protein